MKQQQNTSIIEYLEQLFNNYYYFEDIFPTLRIINSWLKRLYALATVMFGKYRIKQTEFIMYISYYPKYRKLYKQRREQSDGINVKKYASVSRMLHERKFGMKNTDYNALVIDWDLLAEAHNKKTQTKRINTNNRIKSIRSTYSYELNQRIVY